MSSIFQKIVNAAAIVAALMLPGAAGTRASGEVDPGFAPVASKPLSVDTVPGQISLPDGKVMIWGANLTIDGKAGQIFRLNENGTLDPAFDHCGCLLNSITGIIRQSDGKLLVAGQGPNYLGSIVRLNSDGSPDATFSSALGGFGHQSSVAELSAVQPDGRVLATIAGGLGSGFHTGYLVRLNSDGSVDPAFTQFGYDGGRTIHGYVRALELMPDGRFFLAVVTFSGFGSTVSLRRHLANGVVDSAWEAPAISGGSFPNLTNISALALQADGALVVSGTFTTVNGVPKTDFVRILPAGNVDLGFTTSGLGAVGGKVALLDGGKILAVAGGRFVRLNADGSTDGGFIHPAAVAAVVNRFALDPTLRIVFAGQSSQQEIRLFRLDTDGSVDAAFNPNTGLLAEVYALALQNDGRIVAAGSFSQINGAPKRSVVRLNADGSVDAAFDGGTGFSSPPSAMFAQPDGKIIAIGEFSAYNGTPRTGIVRLNTDGSLDTGFAPTVSQVYGASLQSDGKILIAGAFTTVNGVSKERVARLNPDGSLDASLTVAIASGSVHSVTQLGDGRFIVGGAFTGVDGFNRANLVRLNSGGSLDQTFNAGSVSSVNAVVVQPDGKYVCLLGAGGAAALTRRNTDGTADAGFAAPAFLTNNSSDLRLYSVVLQADGSMTVGGNFNSVGGIARNHLVRLSSGGAVDRLFLPGGAAAQVRALISQPDGKIVLGGDFSRLNNIVRGGFGRITPGVLTRVVPFDFDGDGRADIAVFRPSENKWYILRSSDSQVMQSVFAITGDLPAAADFDGDGRTDLSIFRPSVGDWWSLSTISNGQVFAHLGASGDVPLPSDVSGDGRADYVVYRPSAFTWYRIASSNGVMTQIQFGAAGDKPVIGDVDGDGRAEPVIYRPSTGDWWWQSSVDNAQRAVRWGISSDVPSAADFDGDGKTDFAVYRPSEGVWYIRNSSDGSFTIVRFGIAEDKPVPADYDGDGRADIAVYRPSNGIWYLLRSTEGFAGYRFGISTDIPVPNAFVP